MSVIIASARCGFMLPLSLMNSKISLSCFELSVVELPAKQLVLLQPNIGADTSAADLRIGVPRRFCRPT
jgi:hypothetical protein